MGQKRRKQHDSTTCEQGAALSSPVLAPVVSLHAGGPGVVCCSGCPGAWGPGGLGPGLCVGLGQASQLPQVPGWRTENC